MAAAIRRKSYDDPFGYGDDPGYMTQDYVPYEEGGYAGGAQEPPKQEEPKQEAPPPPSYNMGSVVGVDAGKFNDPNKHDFKYDVMRTLSKYDPRKGFSSDVLNDLNALGYGDFSSSGGDRLSLKNAKNAKDAGDFNDQDWIYAFDANNDATKWNFGGGAVADQEEAIKAGNAAALGYPSGGGGGYGGGAGNGGGTSTYTKAPVDFAGLKEALAGMFPNGAFNQDVVNRRVDNVRGGIEKARKSRLATNQALLAERGLIGSGPESRAYQNMDEDLFNTEASAINDAYAQESDAASQRMMQALQIAAGMTAEEARNAVDWFRAQSDDRLGSERINLDRYLGDQQTGLGYYRAGNDFAIGQGQLALGNMNGVNEYNLGLGRLGLDRDRLMYDIQGGNLDRLIEILRQQYGGAGQSAGGYR